MTAMLHQRSRTASAGTRAYSAPARAVAWANSASNCAHSSGDSWARAARTAGPDRSILVVAVVTGPVSRRPAARERSARRPAVADPWTVERLEPAVRRAYYPDNASVGLLDWLGGGSRATVRRCKAAVVGAQDSRCAACSWSSRARRRASAAVVYGSCAGSRTPPG